ncbi:hypothetical protein TNIN_124101 [Trichonephila inaurata madagascariensis]|uniref:Uncharacterized protein n=1 Tax=Trichonephila inaurata madagascariensis TaxID=2747483 RepID=A0A8X6YYP1_9ARAC|nr:hypothetical protein TNIN_124101 [Trichonephila inaurata madagascariensis]
MASAPFNVVVKGASADSQTPKTLSILLADYDTELPTDQAMIIDYAAQIGIIVPSGSSGPQVCPCYFLQLCIADIRKYIIMPTGGPHLKLHRTLNGVGFEMQELIQR